MKVLGISSLKGPNYWSNYRKKLIVVKLDLERYEELPSNELPGFCTNLKNLLPSLYNHRCSKGYKGGFLERLEKGTWLGHVMEHVALELQYLAGMHCGFGRTFSTNTKGIYHVIFDYEYERAGLYAADFAFELISALAQGQADINLPTMVEFLKNIKIECQLGPSTQAIVTEAKLQKIPVCQLADSLITLGYGSKQKKIWTAITSETSAIAVDLASNKNLTKKILSNNFVPVPLGLNIKSESQIDHAIKTLGFPLVIKPQNGNHGRAVSIQLREKEQVVEAFVAAKNVSFHVEVEQYVEGEDFRVLVIDYKVVAVAKRIPAHIVGDGIHDIEQLIQTLNEDPRRGKAHENYLTKIEANSVVMQVLKEQGFDLKDIVPSGTTVYLQKVANLSSGGTAIDVTHLIHPENTKLAEKIARIIGLDICGIDIIAKDIKQPLSANNGAVIEVNAGPGLRMHLSPEDGFSRNVAKPIIDMLFPHPNSALIPIVCVTGTNGKTTVVTLIAKLISQKGLRVGFTTTEGIYFDHNLVHKGDCSGPRSAQAVMQNPNIDFAVLECARGGILKSGLGVDECDISIITNITGDHLGLKDINTLQELARVKAVVAHSTKETGTAILNADDDLTYSLMSELSCQIALFGRHKSKRISEHCERGGLAVYVEDNKFTLSNGNHSKPIIAIDDVPLTYQGRASPMILNIFPVILAGILSNIPIHEIAQFLKSTVLTPEILPGRMNLFHYPNFTVMLDYAHNPAAFNELRNYITALPHQKRIGIIGVAGDRRKEDIFKVGQIAGSLFDEIIIRHDSDFRILNNDEITHLLRMGINSSGNNKITVISNEIEALKHAIKNVKNETFIFFGAEKSFPAIKYLKDLEREMILETSET